MTEARMCYWALTGNGEKAIVAIVVENESGYHPTDYDWGTLEQAQEQANKANTDLGLSSRDCIDIVVSSMFPKSHTG